MALVNSIPIPLGTNLPAFELKDAKKKVFNSDSFFQQNYTKGLIVAFMCNHCPYAKAVWPRLIQLHRYASRFGISIVAINPNIHPDYPLDSPIQMKLKTEEWGIPFPYLVDSAQKVAKLLDARCTPDIYFYDDRRRLIYHGRFDDNWQDESKVKRQELKSAIDDYSMGRNINPDQKPAMGCSIKWL
ncbi:MAG: thioredoxin family protein [Candidatus Omnitrophica bacterium]|nr:thioredoxin family protein [Candidatus Omnitrophota bacterium]